MRKLNSHCLKQCRIRLLSVNIAETSLIIGPGWLRDRTEYAVSLTSCYDTDVVVRIHLKITSPVLFDSSGGSSCLGVGGKVPIPLAVGIGGKEDVIAIGAVDNVPLHFFSESFSSASVYIFGPGGYEYNVGPGTITCNISFVICRERTDLKIINMLIVKSGYVYPVIFR